MSTAIGVSLPRLATAVGKAVSEYAVLGKTPGFTADFIKNKYPSYSSFASAITHSRSGNAVMTDGYGPELVTNGGFDSDSDWTKGAGVSISDGVATWASSTGTLEQDISIAAGKTYAVTFTVRNRTAGGISPRFTGGSPVIGSTVNSDGTYTQYLSAVSDEKLRFDASGTTSLSIDSVSVREMPVLKWAPHNLLQRSEEFDNSYWSKTNATVTANATTAPDGNTTADLINYTTTSSALQRLTLTLTTGVEYTLGVFLKYYDTQWFRVFNNAQSTWVDLQNGVLGTDNSNGATITALDDDWYFVTVPEEHDGSVNINLVTASTDGSSTEAVGGAYVWGAHLYRSDLGGMVDNPDQPPSRASYVPTTSTAKYCPRIGHHVFNGSAWSNAGLLAESEARTNLVVQSHDFNTSWSKVNVSVTSDDAVGPDGLESADLLVANTSNTQHRLDLIPTSSAGTQTFSVYLKPNGYSDAWLRIGSSGSGFNLTDGSTFTTTGGITTTAQEVGNGWYRCSVTTTSASANDTVRINVLGSSSVNDFAGDGTSGIYIYGAMLEEASTPSSLVPTSGSSVTRAAETFTIPSANLPWPSPSYIGSELVTNGTFDTDTDWTKGTGWSISGGVASSDGTQTARSSLYQSPLTVGELCEFSMTVTNRTAGSVRLRNGIGGSEVYIADQSSDGTYTGIAKVAGGTTLVVDATADFVGSVDSISVREINPLSVSIAMDGRMTYADINAYSTVIHQRWYESGNDLITFRIDTFGIQEGHLISQQNESGVADYATAFPSNTAYAPDILVPFDIASRYGSTFIQIMGEARGGTTNTTPTALPDLSSTDLELAYKFMGTIGTFRVWDRDIGDTGLVEATNPSLEPSLSLTFEGTGTNSFIVNDWSE